MSKLSDEHTIRGFVNSSVKIVANKKCITFYISDIENIILNITADMIVGDELR